MKSQLLICLILVCNGCASAIYRGGRYGGVLQPDSSRELVRQAMGTPVRSGEDKNFGPKLYDDFVVRGPVSDSILATGANMGAAMTFGLSELVTVPQALWWSIATRGERQVRVYYERNQRYAHHFVQRRPDDEQEMER